jgi:hypothetical protein
VYRPREQSDVFLRTCCLHTPNVQNSTVFSIGLFFPLNNIYFTLSSDLLLLQESTTNKHGTCCFLLYTGTVYSNNTDHRKDRCFTRFPSTQAKKKVSEKRYISVFSWQWHFLKALPHSVRSFRKSYSLPLDKEHLYYRNVNYPPCVPLIYEGYSLRSYGTGQCPMVGLISKILKCLILYDVGDFLPRLRTITYSSLLIYFFTS